MIDPIDSASSWARRLAAFRTQVGKRTRGPRGNDVTEEALSMCDALIRELAGAQLARDQLRADLRVADAAWDHLFHVMPSACVLTNSGGAILNANRAASRLLNVSATHLQGRELLIFSQDRETCRALLDEMQRNRRTELRARVMLRPRERKPMATELHVAVAPGREDAWLWIMTPANADATPSLEIVPSDHDCWCPSPGNL
jgi:PAS domain-containing protein